MINQFRLTLTQVASHILKQFVCASIFMKTVDKVRRDNHRKMPVTSFKRHIDARTL